MPDQIFQKGVVYHELLKTSETVNTVRYRQKIINLNEVMIERRPDTEKWFCSPITPHHTQRKRLEIPFLNDLLGTLVPPAILTRLGPFRQPLVLIDISRTLHETLQQLRRCRKMAWWLDHFERCTIFWEGIHKLPERWEKYVTSDGPYFE